MILPLVINEEQVSPFTYWREGIQKGICYNQELYAHFQTYSVYDRLKAYDIAYEQSSQGMAVCITVSKTHYKIWLSLRSPTRAAIYDRLSAT